MINFFRQFHHDFSDLQAEKVQAFNQISALTHELNALASEADNLRLELDNLRRREENLLQLYQELDDEKNLLHQQLTESIDMYTNENIQGNKMKIEVGSMEEKLSQAETRIAQLMDTVASLQSRKKETEDTEDAMLQDVQELSLQVSEAVDKLSLFLSAAAKNSTPNLFTSPLPGIRVSELTSMSEVELQGPFGKLRSSIVNLRVNADLLLKLNDNLQSSLSAKLSQISDYHHLLESSETKFETLSAERMSLMKDYERLKSEYNGLSMSIESAGSEREQIEARSAEAFGQLSAFRDKVVAVIAERIKKAHALTSQEIFTPMHYFSPKGLLDRADPVEEVRQLSVCILKEVQKGMDSITSVLERVVEESHVKDSRIAEANAKIHELTTIFAEEKGNLVGQIKALGVRVDDEVSFTR